MFDNDDNVCGDCDNDDDDYDDGDDTMMMKTMTMYFLTNCKGWQMAPRKL